MKHLLTILFIFFTVSVYCQSQVDSTGGLAPLGAYPVTSSKYIKGAQRSVTTLTDRNNIPGYLRDTGMLVYVTSLDSTYILRGGLSNTNWQSYKTGGKGSSKTVLDTVQLGGQAFTIGLFSGGGRVVSVSTIGRNGSGFLPTYTTAGDSTYVVYDYAPKGQAVYKLTVLDASDTLHGGGTEFTGISGGGIDTVVVVQVHKDTTVVYTDTSHSGTTGPIDYNTLINKPTLAAVAGTGVYSDLTGKPTLFNGDYNSLTNKPALKTVATSGLYADLLSKPTLSTVATSGLYSDLLSRPSFATVATSGLYADLVSKPTFATVATTGAYNDLTGKPTLFNGDYNSLINKPTIPAQVNLVATGGVIITGTYPNYTAKLDTNYLNNYLNSHAIYAGAGAITNCYAINTRFGLISEPGTGEVLLQYQLSQRTADSVGVPIIRQGMSSTGGYSSIIALLNSNRQTQINLRNTVEDGTRNFTSNTERAAYVTFLDTLFRNTLAPANGDTLIACANEDGNKNYHTLDTSTNLANQSAFRYYNNELKPMDSIAHLYGTHFKVTTGGATGEVGWYFVWKNLIDSGRTSEANIVAQAVFAPGVNLSAFPTNASYALSIKYTSQLLPYIRTSTIAYFNWHIKLNTDGTDSSHINPYIIGLGAEAWANLTGKKVVTNELSSTSINPNILAEGVADASKVFDYVIVYDGSTRTTTPNFSGPAISLRNTNNSLNAVGVNLANVIQAIKR